MDNMTNGHWLVSKDGKCWRKAIQLEEAPKDIYFPDIFRKALLPNGEVWIVKFWRNLDKEREA